MVRRLLRLNAVFREKNENFDFHSTFKTVGPYTEVLPCALIASVSCDMFHRNT